MRELMFRFFDQRTGKMYTPDNDDVIPFAVNSYGSLIDYKHNVWARIGFDLITMQFTGLLDKNGNKIFDGDIVKCHDNWRGTVYWCIERLQWWADDHQLCELNKPEVIGNTHQNPELLNVDKEIDIN